MAAFSFPQNPSNGQKVTNADTGVTYVYQTVPGKWDVQVKDFGEEFVDITGDTMTGPLKIQNSQTPSHLQPYGLLFLDGRNGNSTNFLEIRTGGFGDRPVASITSFLAEWGTPRFHINSQGLADNPNNYPDGYGESTFILKGRALGSVSQTGNLLQQFRCYYTNVSLSEYPDALRYFGSTANENDITTKKYVDGTALTSGGTIIATGGSVNTSGNLTIRQSASNAQDGRLYLKHADGTTNISMYGAGGGIDMKGNLSFNSTSNTKNIRAYGSSSPVIKFLTGTEGGNVQERLSISGSAVTANVNLISNYGIAGQNIDASGQITAGTRLVVGTTSTLTGNVTTGADLSVGGDLTVTGTFNTSGPGDTFNSRVVIDAPLGSSQPGLAIKTTNNNTTLWNSTQPGTLQFQTTSGNNGGTCGIFVNGDAPNPSFAMAIGAPGKSLDRVFTYSYSSTYGKRIYVYPNWGQSYSNAVNLPDQTPVTLGYLRASGLVTIASTTSTQEAEDPSGPDHGIISAQTAVTVPSQMTLSADLDGGQGFTLKGKTIANPTSHNGDVLKTIHSASNTSAELEYFGSTAGTNSVQTKESVDAAITAASSTQLGETYLFQNKANNVGSTLDGSLLLQYSKSSEGIVSIIVKAENATADITAGDIVGTLLQITGQLIVNGQCLLLLIQIKL